MAKQRITHEYEGQERPFPATTAEDRYFPVEDQPRRKRKPPETGVGLPMIVVLVLLVGVIGFGMVAFIWDLRNGLSGGDPNPGVATTGGASAISDLPSPDTVVLRLDKAGFDVAPVIQGRDRHNLSYDTADTIIDGNKAQILAFGDQATVRRYTDAARDDILVVGDLWVVNLGQGQDARPLADKITDKNIGRRP